MYNAGMNSKKVKLNKKDFLNSPKYRRRFKIIKTFIYSRLFSVWILILAQLALMAFFCIRLERYLPYYFGGSVAISIIFLCYLVNSRGKNEFKIAWLLPVMVLPLFGISLYILYRTNFGGRRTAKYLKKIKEESAAFMRRPEETCRALELYPKAGDIALYLSRAENYAAYTDSSCKYFSSGEEVFCDMLTELEKAEKSIFLEYFIIENGNMWNQTAKILSRKAAEGVDIRILYDSLGSAALASGKYLAYLNDMGIKAAIFMPFIPFFDSGLNTRDHRKFCIIDGQTAYTGGINIGDVYINDTGHKRFSYWKDSAVKIKGPAVRTFTVMFLQLWNLANRRNKFALEDYKKYADIEYLRENGGGVIIPYGDDAYNNEDVACNVYNYILSKSHDYVHIITPYIIIDNTLLYSLIFAARRGVEVSLIVPKYFDHFITFCVGQNFIKILLENKIRVYRFKDGFVHSKLFVSDAKRAAVGTINLDYRSLYHHFEDGVFLYSCPEIENIEADFQNTIARSEEITLKNYNDIPVFYRIIGWLFRIFAPLL